ncbi:MAG: GNAT family N-acetyltransferase [Bacteroidia bacterium]
MELTLIRTDSENEGFRSLVVLLDRELAIRDGDDHAFFAQFNKIQNIRNVVVAVLDGVPVGCGAFKEYEPGVMEVKRMFVQPEIRGKGIAGKILRELEEWMMELGYKRWILETGEKQPEAIRLYSKSGYTRIPNYGQYADVATSVCFEKRF